MRTTVIVLVPVVLLIGLIIGALKLKTFLPNDQSCALGECPLAIYENDSGKTFLYHTATRFTAYFDENKNPSDNLHCSPAGVVGAIPNAPQSKPPLYTAVFETIASGTCTLLDDRFSATIVVE